MIQTRNDYDAGVFNGDIGVVRQVLPGGGARIAFDLGEVELDGDGTRNIELAYAISVHKAQGSEFPAVVLVLTTQHFRMLSRAVLYTAITRARRLLVVVGQSRAFRAAAEDRHREVRQTLLGGWLER